MKAFQLLIILLFSAYSANSQISKEYYIPNNSYNESQFYMPDNVTGAPLDLTRKIYYVKKGDEVDVVDLKLYQGKSSSTETRTIRFLGDEIKMSKIISTGLTQNIRTTVYSSPITIFKVPSAGKDASWTISDGEYGITKYISSWTTVTINNIQKKAIKVVQIIPNISAKTAEYYLYGIGLWKTEILSNGQITIIDKFNRLNYDPAFETKTVFGRNDNFGSVITKYEKMVIEGQLPSDPDVQTKYEGGVYRAIIWSDKLSNSSKYSQEEIEKLGYVYLKVSISDNDHINYLYRNCEKNLLLNVTEWYSTKLAIDIQWYSNDAKHSIGYLMSCN